MAHDPTPVVDSLYNMFGYGIAAVDAGGVGGPVFWLGGRRPPDISDIHHEGAGGGPTHHLWEAFELGIHRDARVAVQFPQLFQSANVMR